MAGKYNKPSSQEGLEKWDLDNVCWVRKKETRKAFANSYKFMPVIFISLGNPKELN